MSVFELEECFGEQTEEESFVPVERLNMSEVEHRNAVYRTSEINPVRFAVGSALCVFLNFEDQVAETEIAMEQGRCICLLSSATRLAIRVI